MEMRPQTSKSGTNEYECVGCGRRERDPDYSVCPDCGLEMRNLGRERDY